MLTIRQISTTEEFAAIKEDWNYLLNKSNAATIFLTWEWAFSWWEAFSNSDIHLYILLVMEDKKIIAIAPLFITKRVFFKLLRINEINFLGTKVANGEYLDFIIDSNYDNNKILTLIFNYLDKNTQHWDRFRLDDIPEKSPSLHCAATIAKDRKYWFTIKEKSICPFVVLPESWNTMKSSLSKKMRKNLEYQHRRLQDRLGVTFSPYNKTTIETDVNSFFALHKKLWNSRGQSGSLTDQKKQKFYHAIAVRFSKKNWLKLWFLKAEDIPIAALFGFQYQKKFYYLQSGYDPLWSKYSIAQVNLACIFENLISEGCSEFDFLRGTEPYKYHWGAIDKKNVIFTFSRRNMKSTLFNSLSSLKTKLWK